MDLAMEKGASRTHESKPQGIRSTVRPHTLTKKWPIFRQGPRKSQQNITKPVHLDKKSQDSLPRCSKSKIRKPPDTGDLRIS